MAEYIELNRFHQREKELVNLYNPKFYWCISMEDIINYYNSTPPGQEIYIKTNRF